MLRPTILNANLCCHAHDVMRFMLVQVELFDAETEKKESMPKLRMCDFLKSEVSNNALLQWPEVIVDVVGKKLFSLLLEG